MKKLSNCYERPLFLEGFVSAFDLYWENSSFKHDEFDRDINQRVNENIADSFREAGELVRDAFSLVLPGKEEVDS